LKACYFSSSHRPAFAGTGVPRQAAASPASAAAAAASGEKFEKAGAPHLLFRKDSMQRAGCN